MLWLGNKTFVIAQTIKAGLSFLPLSWIKWILMAVGFIDGPKWCRFAVAVVDSIVFLRFSDLPPALDFFRLAVFPDLWDLHESFGSWYFPLRKKRKFQLRNPSLFWLFQSTDINSWCLMTGKVKRGTGFLNKMFFFALLIPKSNNLFLSLVLTTGRTVNDVVFLRMLHLPWSDISQNLCPVT